MTVLFDAKTPLGHSVQFTTDGQRHIIFGENFKWGWELPSAFEVRASVINPREIYQSLKNADAYFYVREVGTTGDQSQYV